MLGLLQSLLAFLRFLAGAALFSFMNVVAWRLAHGQHFATGRSACPACGATLTTADLVPVFSWLVLRGKCRHCGAPIAVRYLAVELLGGGFALGCTARFGTALSLRQGLFGMSWAALWALWLLGLLCAIALIDAETQIIPDRLNLAVGLCAPFALLLLPEVTPQARLLGAFCVSLPMFVLALAIPGAFGGGDIKLMFAAGLCLGWKNTLLGLFLAVVTGGGYAAWLLATGKKGRRDHFAFGPFLCAGVAAALLWGGTILKWYVSLL